MYKYNISFHQLSYNNNKNNNASCDECHPCFILGLIRQMARKVIVTDIYIRYARNKWERRKIGKINRSHLQASIDFFFLLYREMIGERGEKRICKRSNKTDCRISIKSTAIISVRFGEFKRGSLKRTIRDSFSINWDYTRWQGIVDLSQWKSQLCSQEFGTSI